jgi:hypothetical protein
MNLTTQEAIDFLNKEVEDNQSRLEINERLYDIYEGDVLTQLMKTLVDDLGESSSGQARSRAVPINILRQIVNKLSQIYQNTPRRSIDPDNASDLELLEYYEKSFNINPKLNYNNELQNLYGYSFQQIVLNKGKPTTRAIPNHRFLPVNLNPTDPTEANVIILLMGKSKDMTGASEVDIRWAWSDDQFIIFDSGGDLRPDIMSEKMKIDFEEIDYINPFGKIPGEYLTVSQNSVMPKTPMDILQLSLLVPVLLTDLNFCSKFQIFSILYGIDVDDENLKMSPAVFWRFKSHKNSDKKPEIGSIKPDVDIDKVLNLAATELALWLQSLGIRPGAVGKLDGDNFSSGISKIIDEADILDHQNKQTELYRAFEPNFWDVALKHMHPVWLDNRALDPFAPRNLFNMKSEVITVFTKKVPVHSRGALAKDYMVEIDGHLISRKEVMRRLNPELSETKIDEIQKEIDEEKSAEMATMIVGATNPFTNEEENAS